MEYMAPALVAGSKHGTELLSFCGLYALLCHLRNHLSSCAQNYEKHMGFYVASCMVQYGFRRDVYLNFLVQFSWPENLDRESGADSDDNAYIGCLYSEKG